LQSGVPSVGSKKGSAGDVRGERREAVQPADVTSGGFIGLWAVLYVILLVTLGILSIRKGHWIMFIVGFFIPLFWFIGALLPRKR
jgi:hypothetical protein